MSFLIECFFLHISVYVFIWFLNCSYYSYENYKGLLDNMIKNDLALKGSFGGVEFFIFPSTQLPENSQRKNIGKLLSRH